MLDNQTLIENMVYNMLLCKYGEVYKCEYGTYSFDFVIPKEKIIVEILKDEKESSIQAEVSALKKANPN